jgi:hypothetical protein
MTDTARKVATNVTAVATSKDIIIGSLASGSSKTIFATKKETINIGMGM